MIDTDIIMSRWARAEGPERGRAGEARARQRKAAHDNPLGEGEEGRKGSRREVRNEGRRKARIA
jgi:hypothetical protein